MEYRRRLIALHQDERGYSSQGKRGSGLVSIEVKGDTAFISVTARDLIMPQSGIYITVLFPCNAPAMPYVLGEIDYNERTMQLHRSINVSTMPYDIDDYKAAAIIFVGSYIGFALVGQSDCMLDWMKIKSYLRLKGPSCLMPKTYKRHGNRGTMNSNVSAYDKETPSPAAEEKSQSPEKQKGENNDMPLREYGKLHFVDNNGIDSSGTSYTGAPYANDFENDEPFKDARSLKIEPFEIADIDEDENDASYIAKPDENELKASVHYDKSIKHTAALETENWETEKANESDEIEDAKGFDYSELIGESKDIETSESEIEREDSAFQESSDEDEVERILSEEIEDAMGFDYNELLGENDETEPIDTSASAEQFETEEEPLEDDEEAVSLKVEEDDNDDMESENELKEVAMTADEEAGNETEETQENIYMKSMSNEDYLKALDPYGPDGETADAPEKMYGDIDPCIYDKGEMLKKMNICRRYGKRLPVKPFPAISNSTWYKVEYPGMGSSFHYLIGSIHDDKGNIKVRCTAVPGPYGINPPAGLTGFTHYMTAQGLGNAGYWVSFINPKTGRPMDTM